MPVLLIAGLAALLFGIILFFAWFGFILGLAKALLPAFLMAVGGVAAYLGWEELKDKRAPVMDFSSPNEASRYKAEAAVYQAQINEIKNGRVIEAERENPAEMKEAMPEGASAEAKAD